MDESLGAWRAVLDDPDEPLYTVSVVADLLGVDPQVIRGHDQRGLVDPKRSEGGHRRYSRNDIERIARVLELSGEDIGTAGIRRILDLEDAAAARDLASRDEPDRP